MRDDYGNRPVSHAPISRSTFMIETWKRVWIQRNYLLPSEGRGSWFSYGRRRLPPEARRPVPPFRSFDDDATVAVLIGCLILAIPTRAGQYLFLVCVCVGICVHRCGTLRSSTVPRVSCYDAAQLNRILKPILHDSNYRAYKSNDVMFFLTIKIIVSDVRWKSA